MATVEYEEVSDWESLTTTVDDYFKHFNNYIFRGQADAVWKLESTLTRAFKKHYPNAGATRDLEENHLHQFRENIRGRSSLDLAKTSKDELWALGQHFGLYTPLLDWTRSPYVAVYFSLCGECETGNRAIWALLEDDIYSINKRIKDKNRKVSVVNPITNHNERLVNQRGILLGIPVGEDLETWIKESRDFDWVTMYKIIFSDKIREDALSALDNMNINHSTLFPDLIGSSLYTNYQLEIEPFLDDERGRLWHTHDPLKKQLTAIAKTAKKTPSD